MISLTALVTSVTKSEYYQKALDIGESVGLTVTAWAAGDPIRSLYHHISECFDVAEQRAVSFISAGFLDYAGATEPASEWLKLLAYESYGYTPSEATYATPTITLTNGGGGLYVIAAGELTAKSSSTGTTYHNTDGGTLAVGPGMTLTLTMVADVAGSDGICAVDEIDTLVTTYLGVTITSSTAATGTDAESAASIVAGCRASLGAMSSNGPSDAYYSVATDSDLTGSTVVTKAYVDDDSTTGDVTTYVAGPSGTPGAGEVTLVQAAILQWATPLCITHTTVAASEVVLNIVYTKKLRSTVGKTTVQVASDDATALDAFFAAFPIYGDAGTLYHSLLESTLKEVQSAHCYDIAVTSPSGDTTLTVSQVAKLGTITPTITIDA